MNLSISVVISSKVEYGLIALLELAKCYEKNTVLSVSQIAEYQNIPIRYLDQILTHLRRNGIVDSQRGAKGGYVLARPPGEITLLEIVRILESDRTAKSELSSESLTLEKAIVLDILKKAEQKSQSVLQGYTLADLTKQKNAHGNCNILFIHD